MTYCWHIHHDRLCERLSVPIEVRARYIRENKPAEEVEVRLRLMRPVKSKWIPIHDVLGLVLWLVLWLGLWLGLVPVLWLVLWLGLWLGPWLRLKNQIIERIHKRECPGCPWDGNTILPVDGP